MIMPTREAVRLFLELGPFEYGSSEQWKGWCRSAWRHIAAAGLADAKTRGDGMRVRLRLLVLAWLVQDFCAVGRSCTSDSLVNGEVLSDWAEILCLDPLVLSLTCLSDDDQREIRDRAGLDEHISRVDEIYADFMLDGPEDYGTSTKVLVVATAARKERSRVVNALQDGFKGISGLYGSMQLCTYPLDEMLAEEAQELEDALCDLENEREFLIDTARCKQEDDQMQALLEEIRSVQRDLYPKALRDRVRKMLEKRAFIPDIDTMARFNWCEQGCPEI